MKQFSVTIGDNGDALRRRIGGLFTNVTDNPLYSAYRRALASTLVPSRIEPCSRPIRSRSLSLCKRSRKKKKEKKTKKERKPAPKLMNRAQSLSPRVAGMSSRS